MMQKIKRKLSVQATDLERNIAGGNGSKIPLIKKPQNEQQILPLEIQKALTWASIVLYKLYTSSKRLLINSNSRIKHASLMEE